ncbi:Fur family transcriptional regulator [Duganella sp. P38]|uniref:Fur family transcriptional regulator n=1 Tax=Duganella sp. P38 TaxID=3423949 RepID=UPI003D799A87
MQEPHHGTAAHQRVQEWIRNSPLRITKARSALAAVLLRQVEPISAEAVFRQLIEDDQNVSLGSVYRILKQMEDEGLVLRDRHVTSGGVKAIYSIRSDVAHNRKYLFQCDVCGRQQRIADAVLAGQLASVAALEGYALPDEILIPARCRGC